MARPLTSRPLPTCPRRPRKGRKKRRRSKNRGLPQVVLLLAFRIPNSAFRVRAMPTALALLLLAANPAADHWPQWRGPLQTGAPLTADPPPTWDGEGTNVRWKTPLPGRVHSTPIVWGDRIFLTAAIPIGPAMPPRPSTAPGNHDNAPVTHKQQFVAIAINRQGGKVLWTKTLREAVPV